LEAIILSAETETLLGEAELKRQELNDAKLLVDDATQQLKSEGFKFHPVHFLF
jgi:structural maintenance of chromosome 3 (chondroitin sulfate proteoglycan 6)